MSYTPINWQTGDTITAEKMNKMDNGWGVESTQLFSETVTTADNEGMFSGSLMYSETIDNDSIVVTFNGTDYNCPRIDAFGSYFYGGFTEEGPDFTDFPFALNSDSGFNTIYTETAGTYTVSVVASTVAVSSQFSKAVNQCVDTSTVPMECVSSETTLQEMQVAFSLGRLMFFRPYRNLTAYGIITSFSASDVIFIPEITGVSATFTDGVFTVVISI